MSNSPATAALGLHFMHSVSKLLEQNAYIRCLMIDFSKAFDSVDHVVLLSKLAQLNLPSFVINSICSFLAGRGQQCKVNGKFSTFANVGRSMYDSGIGSALYVVMESELRALSQLNNKFC